MTDRPRAGMTLPDSFDGRGVRFSLIRAFLEKVFRIFVFPRNFFSQGPIPLCLNKEVEAEMSNSKDDKEPWATLTIANNIVELYEDLILFLRRHNAALKKELRKCKTRIAEQEESIRALSEHQSH